VAGIALRTGIAAGLVSLVLLVGACGGESTPPGPTAPAYPDFTVLGTHGCQSDFPYHCRITISFGGAEREMTVIPNCYANKVRIGQVVPQDCR